MSTTLDKHIKEVQDQVEELNSEKEKLFNGKSEFSIQAVALLCSELKDGINQLFEAISESDIFDKKVRSDLHDIIVNAINSFASAKHDITFSPVINIETKPLEKIISDALSDNKLIYNAIEKMSNVGGEYEAVLKMIEKHGSELEKLKNSDYSDQLEAINTSLTNKTTEWHIEVTKRDELRGYIEKAIIKAK